MKSIHQILIVTLLVSFGALSLPAKAQFISPGGGGLSSGTFSGIAGYIGLGVADFSVISPASRFRMNEGNYVYLGGEREIGKTGLFITMSANFMTSNGETFYNYTRVDGDNFNSGLTDIDFDSQHWELGLGLKFKLFPTSWFRPFGEGGGLFGYHTINYDDSAAITSPNGGVIGQQEMSDTLAGFGYYMEAGVEIDFTDVWGIRAAGRYQITETREFDTLANQKVKYEARIFQFAVSRKF